MALKSASRSLRSYRGAARCGESAGELAGDSLIATEAPPAAVLEFDDGEAFGYRSPVESASTHNNTVRGRFVEGRRPSGGRRESSPAVILLHGWNGEYGYRFHFPLLVRAFARQGLSVAMFELPYHGSRKPTSGRLRNFLSGDLAHMIESTQQSIADIRALVGWLEGRGYGPISFWGMSLGAWLGGLAASVDDRISIGVLVAPVPRIDHAIENLEFCRHIRETMEGQHSAAAELNLKVRKPLIRRENLLIVEPVYDLFAPVETVEEMWRAWGKPEIWRVKHGHISVLLSVEVMIGTGRWLRRKSLASAPACGSA